MTDSQHNVSSPLHNGSNRQDITRRCKPIPELSPKDLEKFWKRVDRKGDDECWLWRGNTTKGTKGGIYGIWRGMRPHRIAYTLLRGPIPANHTLDHLRENGGPCTSTLCINPAHLEPVSQSENTKRYRRSLPRICKRGHRMPETGNCPQCIRLKTREWQEKNREQLRLRARAYYAANREKIRERKRRPKHTEAA